MTFPSMVLSHEDKAPLEAVTFFDPLSGRRGPNPTRPPGPGERPWLGLLPGRAGWGDHQIARFFDGLELLPPGVVSCSRWRPRRTSDGMLPTEVDEFCGVARKG
jgi:S-adenosyl methyltransferase